MNVSYRKKGVPVEIGSKVGRCLCICYHPSRSAIPTIPRCSFALLRVLFSWVKVLLVSDEERNFRKAVELQTFRLLRFRLNYFFQTDCLMFCQEYQNLKERRRWFFNLFSKYVMKILQLFVSLVGLIRYDCKSGSKVFSITLPVNTKRRFLN